LLEKTLKGIEPFTSSSRKKSRFCMRCGEPATKLVKYSLKVQYYLRSIVIDVPKQLKIARLI